MRLNAIDASWGCFTLDPMVEFILFSTFTAFIEGHDGVPTRVHWQYLNYLTEMAFLLDVIGARSALTDALTTLATFDVPDRD